MNKNFLLISLIVLISLLILWVVGRENSEKNTIVFEQKNTENKFVEIDTDKDGLKDWEENLWGTNILNPDTDGDGTSDGEEVLVGRNPLQIPPDSSLPNIFEENSGTDNKTTVTDEISEEIFSNYFTSEGLEPFNADEVSKKVLNNISENTELVQANIKPYNISDLNINNEEVQGYEDSVKIIRDKYIYEGLGSELYVLLNALGAKISSSKKNESYVSLEKAEITYRAITNELLSVEVPLEKVPAHMEITNVFHGLAESSKKMKLSLGDPILAIKSVDSYLFYSDLLIIINNTQ